MALVAATAFIAVTVALGLRPDPVAAIGQKDWAWTLRGPLAAASTPNADARARAAAAGARLPAGAKAV